MVEVKSAYRGKGYYSELPPVASRYGVYLAFVFPTSDARNGRETQTEYGT